MASHVPVAQLTSTGQMNEGIAALKAGDKALAFNLLGQSLIANPKNDQAWLWLSGAVDNDAERKFCLEHWLAINPNLAAATRGLSLLQPDVKPLSPLLKMMQDVRPHTVTPASNSDALVPSIPARAIEKTQAPVTIDSLRSSIVAQNSNLPQQLVMSQSYFRVLRPHGQAHHVDLRSWMVDSGCLKCG